MEELERRMSAPDFWASQEAAQKVVGQLKALKAVVVPHESLAKRIEDAGVLYQLAVEELTRANDMFKDRNLKYDYGSGLKDLGVIYKEMGLSDLAEETLSQALNIAEEIGSVILAQDVLKELSDKEQ